MQVTGCLVTRGNVPIDEILASWPRSWDRVVYDNSMEQEDVAVLGRYLAIERACTEVVFVQDDDCLLAEESFRTLVEQYQEGFITANMPLPFREHYWDSCLIGFGALFQKDLPHRAFEKLWPTPPASFPRTCDVYFTALTSFKWLNLDYENLPWATGDDRMYRQTTHVGERAKALEHARSLR